jgi:hypothetical protein
MAYIGFDLDDFAAARVIARAAGVDSFVVVGGLMELYEYCWREKTESVSLEELHGIFGETLCAKLLQPLLRSGFLTTQPEGMYRPERWLCELGILERLDDGRSRWVNWKICAQKRGGD